MAAVPVAQRMTADAFLAQPVGELPRWRDLVQGEVVVNEPSALHNVVETELLFALLLWARAGEGRGQVFVPPT